MRNLFFTLACLISTQALAWGPTAHRAIGEVAQKYLDPAVRIKVQKVLKGQTLAKVSTWPDEIRSEPMTYSHTFNWHYSDWPDGQHDHDETHSSGKLLTALEEQVKVLKNPEASEDKKEFALKFVVHLVGDLHMPLHIGNGLDQGGNLCKVMFHGKVMNLHALWDEGMIDFTRLSFTELASFSAQGRSKEDILAWKKGSFVDWAKESREITSLLYPEDVIPASNMSSKQYCRGNVVTEQEMPKLGYEYSYRFMPVVEKRVFQAGLRLAGLLNQIFL